ncbi:MAG: large subunit ribosomal protein L23 [Parcubacteria group bacterium Gr01-1014_66]|nr:MAG: large subunit ribosomal protein L23 [Parcubacteria group bacterium Gr01-1014_66]
MDFFSLFKRKKQPVETTPTEKIPSASTKEDAPVFSPVHKDDFARKDARESSQVILHSFRVTEKTSLLQERGVYVFAVATDANKQMVRSVIQQRYGVKVACVRMLHTSGKMRRRGSQEGWRKGYKKALVTLAQGFVIETQ